MRTAQQVPPVERSTEGSSWRRGGIFAARQPDAGCWLKKGNQTESSCLTDRNGNPRKFIWKGKLKKNGEPETPVEGQNLILVACPTDDSTGKERRCKVDKSPSKPCPK